MARRIECKQGDRLLLPRCGYHRRPLSLSLPNRRTPCRRYHCRLYHYAAAANATPADATTADATTTDATTADATTITADATNITATTATSPLPCHCHSSCSSSSSLQQCSQWQHVSSVAQNDAPHGGVDTFICLLRGEMPFRPPLGGHSSSLICPVRSVHPQPTSDEVSPQPASGATL
jgi:hypothetical protein